MSERQPAWAAAGAAWTIRYQPLIAAMCSGNQWRDMVSRLEVALEMLDAEETPTNVDWEARKQKAQHLIDCAVTDGLLTGGKYWYAPTPVFSAYLVSFGGR